MNNMIQLLHTFFFVCIILAGVFFVLSVILFFAFDIRTIFNIRTGRAKKKTIQEMQAANSRTDVLKVSKTGQRTRRGSLTGPLGAAPISKKLPHSAEISSPPQPQKIENAKITQASDMKAQINRTQSASFDMPETSVLGQTDDEMYKQYNIKLTKRVVLIHTEETVP